MGRDQMSTYSRSRCDQYLVGVLETPEASDGIFDIGGTDVLTYKEMLMTMAEILGKKRLFVPAPMVGLGVYAYLASPDYSCADADLPVPAGMHSKRSGVSE